MHRLSVAQTAGAAPGGTPGIDVSNWQRTIDWSAVARNGYRFAMVKASEGTGYVDPDYAYNRSHGELRGLRIGAYDFARPSGATTSDAAAAGAQEARHFLAAATPKLGELRPALDMETSGGLGPTRLNAWIGGWVGQVRTELGYKPVIYSSPYFWETAVGNSQTFARQGLRLWHAQWTSAASPSLPAAAWGGRGWTAWQWADCGTVWGINGCVDMDVLHPYSGLQNLIMGAPRNLGSPQPSGTLRVGHTLAASLGEWRGPAPITYTVYWGRCPTVTTSTCSGLRATGLHYRLQPSDAGSRIRIIVDAHNAYSDAWIASPPSAPVSP